MSRNKKKNIYFYVSIFNICEPKNILQNPAPIKLRVSFALSNVTEQKSNSQLLTGGKSTENSPKCSRFLTVSRLL